ncbi:hypothetical protein GCM10011376_18090 [Nocardioides flavus (ex Wang et al. 2016)]|uniref:Uncharacterized protein n=1 Tax=Nocardioides flavus (ex Wang et al. 2016) TaxID=2058780 RepID=A0ABQ3HKM4_9ACTN|nr:DUF6886 family protein [Nocardioides flavus (ex Wang et al. 2016)]GHE17199.1 hypothetical protein GCM10011376_18090 [Nocardioides flavus (ex Wang et al. 2016)]
MLPRRGEVLHFSEDPSITRFEPHVAATAQQPEAYVWAVDATNSPCYWFPRHCPRVCSWDEGVPRIHAIEDRWLEAVRTTRLYAYRFAADDFEPFGERPHAHVATRPVSPLAPPEEVGDLVRLHAEHGIELLVLPALGDHFADVRARGLEFSAIRMGNAGIGPAGPFPTRR